MTTNLPATEPVSEWTTKRADQLAVGDHIAGDMLPLGQPGKVIYRRLFQRDRTEWMFVAFAQWDGFHDSTTFLASAAVRVRVAEPKNVADPTGLAYSRPADGDEPQPVGGREPMHTGGLTEQGLVDETPGPCWHGDILPGRPCPGSGPDCGQVGERVASVVFHGAAKPPYGSPEREAYERGEAEYLDLPRCPNCHGRHDVADGCH